MTEKNTCWEEMTTQQLDEELHAELGKKTKNREKILRILHVLEDRELSRSVENMEEVETAWRQYKRHHRGSGSSKRNQVFLRAAAFAAVLCILIFSIPPIFGEASFLEFIVNWTDDVFQFIGTKEEPPVPEDYEFKTDNPGLQKIYDTVTELGVTQPVVPMWVPDGYDLTDIKTAGTVQKTILSATLEGSGGTIWFVVDVHAAGTGKEHTKETADVERYEVAGCEYYIFVNEAERKITWRTGNAECTISIIGDSVDVYKLIDSIHGG